MFNYCRKLNRWKIHFILDGYLLYENTGSFQPVIYFLSSRWKTNKKKDRLNAKKSPWNAGWQLLNLIGVELTSIEVGFLPWPRNSFVHRFFVPNNGPATKMSNNDPQQEGKVGEPVGFLLKKRHRIFLIFFWTRTDLAEFNFSSPSWFSSLTRRWL